MPKQPDKRDLPDKLVTEDDLEDFLLERSEKFWKMIDRARRGKSVSLESARRKLKI